jgi:hypothetical protein
MQDNDCNLPRGEADFDVTVGDLGCGSLAAIGKDGYGIPHHVDAECHAELAATRVQGKASVFEDNIPRGRFPHRKEVFKHDFKVV